jgi:Maf-like protein
MAIRRVVSQVAFKRLSAAELDAYLTSREWRGKAGGYAIQGCAAAFIPWIAGSYSNVVGLPLCETAQLLAGRPERLVCAPTPAVRPSPTRRRGSTHCGRSSSLMCSTHDARGRVKTILRAICAQV